MTHAAGDAPDSLIHDMSAGAYSIGAYVTNEVVNVCSHGVYVDDDHCTDPFMIDPDERFSRALPFDGVTYDL